jgi:hypothetical protein
MSFDRRQYDLIRQMALAAVKSPDANFALMREIVAVGEIAEGQIAALDTGARESAALAEADDIKARRKAAQRAAQA